MTHFLFSGTTMIDYDETRKNIRTKSMSETERKEMFQKFVDGGGKVLSEREKRHHKVFDREKQKEFRNIYEERTKKRADAAPHKTKKKAPVKKKKAAKKSKSSALPKLHPLVRFVHSLRIRFNLMILGVTDFSGLTLQNSFIDRFNREFKAAAIEVQLAYLEIFKNSGAAVADRIINYLDKQTPLYFELIELGANIYDREVTGEIIDEFIAFNDQVFKSFDMATPFTEYFKRLYLVINHQHSMIDAFDKSLAAYTKVKRESARTNAQRKKVKTSIVTLCDKLFPRLYWLFCLYNSRVISLFDIEAIDEILGIDQDSKPGSRTPAGPSKLSSELAVKTKEQVESEEEEKLKEAREEIKKKSAPQLSEETKRGLELMSHINMLELKKKFLKKSAVIRSLKSDSITKSFLVFREFDEEYSIIFMTNKIKLSVPADRRHDTDYRAALSELNDEIRRIDNDYNEYFETLEAREEHELDKPTTQNQYFHYSKRLTELDNDIKNRGRALRSKLRAFYTKIIDTLEVMAKDMESEQKIVQNPQEMIELDYELEGNKKLKDKKIYQAVGDVMDFSYGFLHRLSHGNDLSEASVLEVKADTAAVEEGGQQSAKPEQASDKLEAPAPDLDDGSLLDELDKLI